MNFIYLWIVTKTLLCGCGPDARRYDFHKVRSKYRIDKIGVLASEIIESSGLAHAGDSLTFWTHNDGGSPAELFRVSRDGRLEEKRFLPKNKNRDWEDLAQDQKGRLFIGDFGNNSSSRTDLRIDILAPGWETSEQPIVEGTITFSYAEQTANPSRTTGFDCEAFFFHNDSLFLFSKNTSRRPRYTMLYKLPARPGNYSLTAVDSIRLNETITSADIRSDGKQFVLLSYGKIFFFDIEDGIIDFKRPANCLKKYRGQTEAILYIDGKRLLMTNEKGKLFELRER